MKIRNLVLGMMTCAAFTACTNEDLVDNNGGSEKLKGEAYVAIDIVIPGVTGTRADGGFETGTGEESKVNSATFLFFDAVGNQCANKTLNEGDFTWTGDNDPAHSTEKISVPVLVLNPVNGAIPTSVIAVLNATEEEKAAYLGVKLSLIKGLVGKLEVYKNGFYMSNSVYGKDNAAVMEVPLTLANLATTEKLAKENPVKIPVERIVARVDLNKNKISESSEQTVTIDGKDVKVKAVIKGWKITSTNPDSYLLKQIEMTWNTKFNPWNWNDEANRRSYWAKSATPATYDLYTYKEAVANNANTSEYCLENTSVDYLNSPTTASTATKLWVVAQLVTSDNKPISIMDWRGNKTTPDGVKNAVASGLKKYYYVKSGTAGVDAVYETILPTHLKFVAGTNHYQAKIALADDTQKFYTKGADGNYTDATAALTTEIGGLPEAFAWTDGMTYYYANIQHVGEASGANSPIYGVVRNHIYKLKLSSIGGLGTPIYNPDTDIDPTKPTQNDKSYVAAEVEVLKWKVVEQNIDLN